MYSISYSRVGSSMFFLFSIFIREAGELMTGGSRRCISVSTLAEAEFYANGGFDDITYAYPLSPDKVPQATQLLLRLQKFNVLIDNHVVLDSMVANRPVQGKKWSVFLKVNCGNNRGGSCAFIIFTSD